MKKQISKLVLAIAALALCAQQNASQRAAWNKPAKPFRIIGNLYYVGAAGVSSFLITTPAGDILLDGGLAETAPLIERNIAALGFKMTDVKYLLNSHAHYDHCGGLPELKKRSGARVVCSRADSETLNTGHELSYGPGQSDMHLVPVKLDQLIDDGGTVSLGGVTLTAHLTPGHTKGCTTWTMPVIENGEQHQVVFYCSTTVAGNQLVNNPKYPKIVSDYRHSFALARQLPCDVFLAPHPEMFHMEEKRKQLDSGNPNAFVNKDELKAFVDRSEQDFNKELMRQQAEAKTVVKQ